MTKINCHKNASGRGYFYTSHDGRNINYPTQSEYEAQENSSLKRFCIFAAIICAILGLILFAI